MADRESAPANGIVAGLAIEDLVLRVVVVDRNGAPRIVDVAEADLPTGVVRDGRVVDSAAVGARISELWRVMELVGVPTYLGFQPADAVLRCVRPTDPGRPARPIALVPGVGAWPAEVADILGAIRARDGVEPVWAATPVTVAGEAHTQLAACRREDMTNAVWAARRSGVWVAGVELSAIALARALDPRGAATGVIVDRSGGGPATFVAVVDGVAIHACRPAPASAGPGDPPAAAKTAGAGPDHDVAFVAADAGGLWALGRDDADVLAGFAAIVAAGEARMAPLRRAGSGLAAASPVPAERGATALGLALAAIDDSGPGDLQVSLLDTSATLLGARRATIAGAERGEVPPPPTSDGPGTGGPGEAPGPRPVEGPDDGPEGGPDELSTGPEAALGGLGVLAWAPVPTGDADSDRGVEIGAEGGAGIAARRLRWGAAVAAVAGATAVGAVWASRGSGSDLPGPGLAASTSATSTALAPPPARLLPTPSTVRDEAPTTEPAPLGTAPSTSSTARAVVTTSTSTPSRVVAPIVALPPHGAVYAGGKLYLEGAVADRATADRLRSLAAAVVGPDNVIGDYVVDPAAPRDSAGRVRIEDTILFAPGSTVVAPGYAAALDLLVKAMVLNPNARLVIEGHSDLEGPLQPNLELSRARADAMVATLVARGVDPARLVAVGKGPFLPRADNGTEAGRQQNRRIELTFVGLLS